MRVIELFGGIGAVTQALKRLNCNVEIVDYVEIDKYAVKSFNAINGTHFEPQDITKWNKHFENIDLISHGSPCQDFSVAGKQAGGDQGSGTRSSLMYETLRIVQDIKPKYVIWENVKNLLSKKHKHNFDKYVDIMNEGGYNSYFQVLNAKDYGIPQNRERVYTISIRKDIDNGTFTFPEKEELKLRLKDMLEAEVDEKYYLSDKMINYVLAVDDNLNDTKFSNRVDDCKFNKTPSYAITVRGAGGNQRGSLSNFIYKDGSEEIKVKNLKQQLCEKLIENKVVKGDEVINHSYTNSKTRDTLEKYIESDNGISPTLTTRPDTLGYVEKETLKIKNNTKKGYLEAEEGDGVYTQPSTTKRGMVQKGITPTLTQRQNVGVVVDNRTICLNSKAGRNGIDGLQPSRKDRIYDSNGIATTIATSDFYNPSYTENLRIRKLTPRECWRLMGFSDENYEKAAKENSNAQLYKQAGNSIVVNVLEKIFKNLF